MSAHREGMCGKTNTNERTLGASCGRSCDGLAGARARAAPPLDQNRESRRKGPRYAFTKLAEPRRCGQRTPGRSVDLHVATQRRRQNHRRSCRAQAP